MTLKECLCYNGFMFDGELKLPLVNSHTGFFSGRLLAAMPTLDGDYFERAVIFICYHDDNGAMGFMINQPISNADFTQIMLADEETPATKAKFPIYTGGPVEDERGFFLHSDDVQYEHTQKVGSLCLTSSLDIMNDVLEGKGPQQFKFIVGYTGWGALQLEQEYEENSWLLLPYDRSIIFSEQDKWHDALKLIGVDSTRLSAVGGIALIKRDKKAVSTYDDASL